MASLDPDTPRTQPGAIAAGGMFLAVIGLVGFNLRSITVGTTPVIPLLQPDLHLSYTQAGVILAAPIVFMGACALPGASFSQRYGPVKTTTLGLLMLAVGGVSRALAGDFWILLLTTVLVGSGIGVIQPLLPVVIKTFFPRRIGGATALYTTGMGVGATAAAVLTAPVLLPLVGDLTWRGTFLAWGSVCVLTFGLWLRQAALRSGEAGAEPAMPRATPTGLGLRRYRRNPFVWIMALLFAYQGTLFYTLVSWIPTFYNERGWTLEAASLPLMVLTLTQIPALLLFPLLADRYRSHRKFYLAAISTLIAGFTGLLVAPEPGAYLWGTCFGIGIAGLFVMGFTLPPLLLPREEVGPVTGIIFTCGFVVAGFGPIVLGLIRDLTGTFTGGFFAILLLTVAMLFLAWRFLPDG